MQAGSSSSSAGAGPKPPESGGDDRRVEAHAIALTEILVLDHTADNRQALTNLVTCESVQLPPGTPWELEFADDDPSDACVLRVQPGDADGGELILVSQLLTKTLFRRGDSGDLLVKCGGAAPQALDHMQLVRKEAILDICVQALQAKRQIRVYIFSKKRAVGMHFYFPMPPVYKLLGLSSFKGFPSLWVQHCFPRWQRYLHSLVGVDLYCASTHGNSSDKKLSDLVPRDRCLPCLSYSTLGFLALLCRWCGCSRENGGLVDIAAREAAKTILVAMLSVLLGEQDGFAIDVQLTEKWSCRWPRPPLVGVDTMRLVVKAGMMDMTDFHSRVSGSRRNPVAAKWWKLYRGGRATHELRLQEPVLDVLLRMCGPAGLLPFFGQLAWRLASLIEEELGRKVTEPKTKRPQEHLLGIRWAAATELFDETAYRLSNYVLSCAEATRNHYELSLATDKVDRGFDNDAASVAPRGKKRKLALLAGSSVTERHRAWLQRSNTEVKSSAWRPQKRYRVAARRWCQNVDNALRCSTRFSGLEAFLFRPGHYPWRPVDWQHWPHLGASSDQGSDALAAMHALQLGPMPLNLTKNFDFAHGAHKDLDAALAATSLRQFWLLLMVSMNLPHGPWRNDERWHQLRSAMNQHYKEANENTCALFGDMCNAIHAHAIAAGHAFPGEASREAEVWDFMKEREFGAKKGRRIDLCRFLGSLTGAKRALETWALDLYERTYLALECDFLHGRRFDKIVIRGNCSEAVGEGGVGATTSGNQVKLDEKVLRTCCANSVAISVIFLADDRNRQIVQTIVGLAQGLCDWHSEQDTRLRSVSDSEQWLKEQTTGSYFHHLHKIIGTLQSETFVDSCGFRRRGQPTGSLRSAMLVEDEEAADLAGQFAVALLFARLRRSLWLIAGWPHAMFAILAGGRWTEIMPQRFEQDATIWRQLDSMDNKSAPLKRLADRHLFKLVANRQLLYGLEATDFKITREFKDLILRRSRGIFSTQLIEDEFKVQKVDKQVRGSKQFRRPEAGMCTVLQQEVASKRHRYTPVEFQSIASALGQRLPRDAFEPQRSLLSMSFDFVSSTAQSPPWRSPSATNVCCPVADLFLLRECSRREDLQLARNAFLGQLCDVRHRLILCIPGPNGERENFYLAGPHFSDSSVLVWPLQQMSIPGSSVKWYDLDTKVEEPCLISVLSLDPEEILAAPFAWHSWAWPQETYEGMRSALRPGIRLIATSSFDSLLRVACFAAWWSLPKSVILDICADQDIHLDAGLTLYEVIFSSCKIVLGCDDAALCNITHQRIVRMDSDTAFSSELLEVDEAVEVLDRNDHKKVKDEQAGARKALDARMEFAADYQKHVVKYKPAAKGASRRKKTLPLPEVMSQAEAKKFLPPGASIWQGRTMQHRDWNGHYLPYKRCSFKWAVYSEQKALKLCLATLWRQYLEHNGLARSECPRPELLDLLP